MRLPRKPVIIALDSGTSVVKAIAFDSAGTQLSEAARPNVYAMLSDGGAEQDMRRTWDDAGSVLRELVGRLSLSHPDHEPVVLAVTAQGDGTWLVDAEGEPTGPGLLWLDARAASIVDTLKATGAAEAAFVHTGSGLAACQQAPQLHWLARHRPAMVARATHALHPKDYLYMRLTGVRATSPCEGSFTFGDFRTREYSDGVIQALDAEAFRRLLPPMIDGTTASHPLAAHAAEHTGLPSGLPVVLGYVDVVCTTLGAGIYGGGADAGVTIVGSTGMHNRLVPDVAHVAPSPAMTGYCMAFPVPGHTVQAQSNMASTINIDWMVDFATEAATLATGGSVSRNAVLDAINDGVAAARPGAIVYHPFISTAGERGPFTDSLARAAVIGLDQNVRLMDFARGIYEGLCFAARDCYAAVGGAPSEIRVTGGAARSHPLRAMLAACLGRPVLAAAHVEAGAAGVAMMAAVQAGLFADMKDCAATWIAPHRGTPVRPDSRLAAQYDRLFPVYREAYQAMPAIWRHLHAAREGFPRDANQPEGHHGQ